MIEVKFKYKGWFGRNKSISRLVPTNYAEMNQRQFSALTKVVKGYISTENFYSEYFNISLKMLARLDHFQLYMLTQRVRIDGKFTNRFVVKNLGRLNSPEDKLQNVSFQQFISVDQLYGWYIYTEKREYLDLMLANLYIEPGKTFFDGNYSERVKYIKSLDEKELYPAVVNWMLIKNWLSHSYKDLFSSSSTSQEMTMKGKRKKPRPGNWLEVFDALVGDNLAYIEQYKHLNCMDALRIINNRIKNNKKK